MKNKIEYLLRGVIGINDEHEKYKQKNLLIYVDSNYNYLTTIQESNETVESASKKLSAEYWSVSCSHQSLYNDMYPKELLDTWNDGLFGMVNCSSDSSVLEGMDGEISKMIGRLNKMDDD